MFGGDYLELTIGKFAKAVNTTIRTLRHYEKIGLLVPSKRNELNQKIYTGDELKKFYNIQLLKSLNLPLNEIKQRLEDPEYSFKEMLEIQEALLLDKRDKINMSLGMMTRIKALLNETGDLNNEDLMLLMNSIRLEEDQRKILNRYFSIDTIDAIIPKSKSQQIVLDRLNMRLLSFFQAAIHNELTPESHEVQRELKEIIEMLPVPLEEFYNSNNNLEKQLGIIKAILPVNMTEFLGAAIRVLFNSHHEGKGE